MREDGSGFNVGETANQLEGSGDIDCSYHYIVSPVIVQMFMIQYVREDGRFTPHLQGLQRSIKLKVIIKIARY